MNMEYTSYKPIRLSGEEITDLVKQYKKSRDNDILDMILNSCFIIVKSVVNKYHTKCRGDHYEDLIQEGMISILTSIENFDVNRDTLFTSYCYWLIEITIKRYVYRNSFVFSANMNELKSMRLYIKVINENPDYTKEDLKEKDIDKYDVYKNTILNSISIDYEDMSNVDQTSIRQLLKYDDNNFNELEDSQYSEELLLKLINKSRVKVSDDDIMMIKMSYGINEEERTPEDISNILDIDVKNIYKRKSYIFKRIREKGEYDVYSY